MTASGGEGLDEGAIAYAGVAGQAELLATRRLTSAALVDLLLARIERLQPRLNPFRIVLAGEARRAAAAADEARANGDPRPLLGVPIAVKDNVPVAGHAAMAGTGSPQPEAAEDDELVHRLRQAGMVVLGLTHLPELALWAATESEHHGITRNPWDTARAPGGSSGGSAVAVAAGLVPAAHGTDGLGSIRIPASACGVVGLKPTHGLVPLGPDPDHWEGMSHAGFLTRSAADTALLLDTVVQPSPGLSTALDPPAGLRVAVSTKPVTPVRLDPSVRAVFDTTVERLREMGHTIVPRDPEYGLALPNAATIRFLAGMAAELRGLADPGATERRSRTMARIAGLMPPRAVQWARRSGAEFGRRMTTFFTDADVLLTPTLPVLPLPAGGLAGRGAVATFRLNVPQAGFTGAWNTCGLPALSAPVGVTQDGVPVGMQLVGPAGSEARLLALAAALERTCGWTDRRPPLD